MMRNQQGFTLLEILISLVIFAVIVVGALGVLGAADAGGFLEGFPSAFVTARVARDYTAASIYLQSFQEYVHSIGGASATPGTYCKGTGCGPEVELPAGLAGYPMPPGQPYQIQWTRLDVLIEQWHWNDSADTDGAGPDLGKTYCLIGSTGCGDDPEIADHEYVTRVRTTLTWTLRGTPRTLTMERFVP